ncbi:MAG: hypothetical protein IKR85_01750 [Clostridia bacterium]|nr:hypothetical protein [Clostridia bacterium]
MKSYHKRLLITAAVLAALAVFSGVFITGTFNVDATALNISPVGPAQSADRSVRSFGPLPDKAELDSDGYDTQLSPEFELALEDGLSELYFNEKTGETALKQLSTGHIWYSNPQDRDSETQVEGTTRLRIGAQVTLSYYTSQGVYGLMDSYNDCVAYKSMSWEKQDGELVVSYRLGKTVVTLADVPQQISVARLDGFLAALDDKDREDFLKNYRIASITGQSGTYAEKLAEKYPNVVNEDIYYLTKDSTRILTKIRTWLDECGYTDEDLEYDNKINQVVTELTSRAHFAFSLSYRLDGGALLVTLRGDSLEYEKTIPPGEIRLMEYFGAGGKDEMGYMLLPDGSGTLMYYNNGRANETPFSMRLYGNDTVSDTESAYVADKKASLPVFGIKNGRAALLATIEQGASLVTLNARVSGMQNSYNTVYPSVLLTAMDRMSISDSQQIYFEDAPYRGDVTVRYQPLSEADNDYMGMARAYRQRLLDAGVLGESAAPVYPLAADVVCAAPVKKVVLGLPVKTLEAMTDYSQIQSIASALPAEGSAVWLRLEGWQKGGLNQSALKGLAPESALGGKAGFNALLSRAAEEGWTLLPEVWLQTAFGSSGFTASHDCVRDLCRDTAVRYEYDYVSRYRRYGTDAIWQLNARRAGEGARKYLADAAGYRLSATAVADTGVQLWSDFARKQPMNREKMLSAAQDTLGELSNGLKLAFANPNLYALAYAAYIYDLPTSDSAFRVTDESVPFYQAVIRGSADYVCEALNYADDYRTAYLQAVEYGSGLQYTLTWQSTALLKNAQHSYINKGRFSDWQETIDADYAHAADVLAPLAGVCMTGHERLDTDLYQTLYADGTRVIVNYGTKDRVIDGTVIPARDFAALRTGDRR